jgi:hypothetical protein
MPFDFLGLPAELRSIIYDFVEPQCNAVSIRQAGFKARPRVVYHPLALINRQLQQEFDDHVRGGTHVQLYSNGLTILADVFDYNFRAIRAYMEELRRKGPNTAFMYDTDEAFNLIIELDISGRDVDTKKLKQWFSWLRTCMRSNNEPSSIFYQIRAPVRAKGSLVEHFRSLFGEFDQDEEEGQFLSWVETWERFGSMRDCKLHEMFKMKWRAMRDGELEEEVYEEDLEQKEAMWRSGEDMAEYTT